MKPEPTGDQVRATLRQLAEQSGSSLAALSRMIRRDSSYLGRFCDGGPPNRLADHDRHMLARFFDADERLLGKWDEPPLADRVRARHSHRMIDPTTLSDADLIAAYQRTSGEPGDPDVEALANEIERRNLDL